MECRECGLVVFCFLFNEFLGLGEVDFFWVEFGGFMLIMFYLCSEKLCIWFLVCMVVVSVVEVVFLILIRL